MGWMASPGSEAGLTEPCRELGAKRLPAAAAACFIFCHGAFSAALRLPMIYRLAAASSLHGASVCVTTRMEINGVKDI